MALFIPRLYVGLSFACCLRLRNRFKLTLDKGVDYKESGVLNRMQGQETQLSHTGTGKSGVVSSVSSVTL